MTGVVQYTSLIWFIILNQGRPGGTGGAARLQRVPPSHEAANLSRGIQLQGRRTRRVTASAPASEAAGIRPPSSRCEKAAKQRRLQFSK